MNQVVKPLVVFVALVFGTMLPTAAAFGQSQDGQPPVSAPSDPADPNDPAPPPEPPMEDPSPQVAVALAKLHEFDTQQALQSAQQALDIAHSQEATARARRDAFQSDRDQKHDRLKSAVTAAYVRGDDATDDIAIDPARVLVDHAIGHDLDQFEAAEASLQSAQRDLTAAVHASNDAQATRDAAQAAVDEATLAVSQAARLTNRKDVSPSVLGDPVLTADELAGWYTQQAVVGYAARVDLATMTGYYVDEGKAEKIRGDVAFAQSMVETGAFTSPLTTHNNFAGIGACDSCETGFDFETPQLGVRAQAQLLHAYADKTLKKSGLANPPILGNPEDLGVRGCCVTWNQLTGTWASDPNYGPKLMNVYLSMLQYALAQRVAAAAAAATAPPAAAAAATVFQH